MALLYRAIWHDETARALDAAQQALDAWMTHKGASDLTPTDGAVTGQLPARFGATEPTDYELTITRAADDGQAALRADLREDRPDGTRWDTTLRAWHTDDDTDWFWVDVHAVGPGVEDLVPVAPRLVHELLDRNKDPRHGDQPVSTASREVSGFDAGRNLATALSRTDRAFPVVVFTDDADRLAPLLTAEDRRRIIDTAARENSGIAEIVTADQTASNGLVDALGRDLAVWGGAFRIYMPSQTPYRSSLRRNRVVLPDRYVRYRTTASRTIGRYLAPHSATRRPPPSYAAAKTLLDRRHAAPDTPEIDELRAQLERLGEQNAVLETRLDDRVIDWEIALQESGEVQRRLDYANRQLTHLRARLGAEHLEDDSWTLHDSKLPANADNLSQALEHARQYLADHLVIPDTAPRDLADLDATVTATAWGQTAWRAFQALHGYAVELQNGFEGRFWNFCEQSGLWPANDKKLAMTESETVKNSESLSRKRVFAVDTSVDPEGEIYMDAHIKIATGGGNLAPRIYFYTDRTASKVHVGFFGPHKHVPNTKT